MSDPVIHQDRSENSMIFVHSKLDDMGLTAPQFRLYSHLTRRADLGVAWPGIDSIARVCKMSKPTVIESVKELEKRGMMTVARASGVSNIYTLTRPSLWNQSNAGNGEHQSKIGNAQVKNKERHQSKIGNERYSIEGNPKKDGSKYPTTEEAKRISSIYGRKETTAWTPKEIKAFKALMPIDSEDLRVVEIYYAESRVKSKELGKKNYLRRELFTFLNNFRGEVDRANGWIKNGEKNENNSTASQGRISGTHDPSGKIASQYKRG